MKILKLNYNEYFYYPEGITNIEEFIAYANDNYHSFVPLISLETENCVCPYFIKEDIKQIYMNLAGARQIAEVEATILSREEYDARLKQVVAKKCINCENYVYNPDGDNLGGHRDRISLDGECWDYMKKTEDNT